MRIVLILLAGLVILLHSIIPHHHHSDLYSDHNYNDFGTTQTSGESSDKANKHCHAFNNIVTEKFDTKTFDTKPESNFILLFVCVLVTEQFNNQVETTTFFVKNIVPFKQYFSAELSFRGPPFLA